MKIVNSFSSRFFSSASHPFHLVDGSPYPLLMSFALLGFAVSLVSWLTGFSTGYLGFAPILLITLIAFLWFRDIIREAAGGYHTSAVQRGIFIGFLLFLLSEVM
jgi:cytochrome c oxidase subunit 3